MTFGVRDDPEIEINVTSKILTICPQVVDTDEAERKMLEEIRELCFRTSAVKKEVAEAS